MTANTLATDHQKLEWSGRLCALLLNDGTDVMRWFLLENLPRKHQCEPQLQKILNRNKKLFENLCQGPSRSINEEMFDILFREDGKDVGMADLEIDLIFILIRFLCKLKHPSWKWWNEEPLNHQATPLFDVIRLHKFKQQMKDVVHDYKITEESFGKIYKYIASVLDRLQCYKVSARKWQDDVIKNHVEDYDETAYVKLIDAMRWQTLTLDERDEMYLLLKDSRALAKSQKKTESWEDFMSNFGQKRIIGLLHMDCPKSAKSGRKVESLLITKYNQMTTTPAIELNEHHLKKQQTSGVDSNKRDMNEAVTGAKLEHNLTLEESQILQRINNDVFIKDFQNSDLETSASLIEERLRELYITKYFEITPLQADFQFRIHMDNVMFNINKLDSSEEKTPLPSWRDMFKAHKPFHLIVKGEWSCGKTTLLKKICYDWATQNSIQDVLSHRFVFYIDLALIKSRAPYTSLSECVIEQCCEQFTVDEVEFIFKQSDGRNVLLIFDGVERMQDAKTDGMSELSDVICGLRWSACSVIISTTLGDNDCSRSQMKLYSNLAYFTSRRSEKWQSYCISGFTTHDVITHARLYLKWTNDKRGNNHVQTEKNFLNFCRVFQRDVYKGFLTSPMIIFLLGSMWTEKTEQRQPATAETLGDLIKHFFEGFRFNDDDSVFWEEIVQRTMNGKSGNFYNPPSPTTANDLIRRGVLLQLQREPSLTKFSHVLFEDYAAAFWFCLKCLDKKDLIDTVSEHASSLQSAVRLRYFFLFCCSLNSEVAEQITCVISTLIQQSNAADAHTVHLREAVKHLTLQTFYEIKGVTSTSFLTKSSVDGRSISTNEHLNGGSELRLRHCNSLSNQSKQAILFITSQCQPALTRSGTVFPFLDISTFWIRSLQLLHLRGKQMTFVASLFRNLPFLEEAILEEVSDVKDNDITALCNGLKCCCTESSPAALHTLEFTLRSASPYHMCTVSTYKNIGELLEYLPYLDTLRLTIFSSQLFFSLFSFNSQTVVPLTAIDLSKSGFDTEQCHHLTALLPRLIFVRKLILSNNKLEDGFASICSNLHRFRDLNVIDVSSACLCNGSVLGIASALRHPATYATLEHLDLSNNQVHDPEAMLGVARAVELLVQLQFLDMSNNYIGDNGVCVLSKSLSKHGSIENLRLNSVQIGPLALSSLNHYLRKCSKLKFLSLAGNFFDSEVLQFCDILRTASGRHQVETEPSKIETLDLSGINDNLSVLVSSQSVDTFIKAIRDHNNIKRVMLRHLEISYVDLIRFLETCQQHAVLEELQLSKSLVNLTDKQAQSWNCLKLA